MVGDGVGGLEVGGATGPPLTGTGVGGVEVGRAAGELEVGGAAGPPLTGAGVGGVEVGGVDVLDRFPPVGPSLGPVDGAVWSVWELQGERFRAFKLCMLGNRRVSCIATCVFALFKPFKRD